jgi:hypothetical protein
VRVRRAHSTPRSLCAGCTIRRAGAAGTERTLASIALAGGGCAAVGRRFVFASVLHGSSFRLNRACRLCG